MDQSINLCFESSIDNIVDVNESFASARIRVCYTGVNRNHSSISKESIENAIPSMYNCPVVCNYDARSNTIGGHDMDVITDNEGKMRVINLTDAVGVVPQGAKYGWENIEDNGVSHEYFTTDVILWKRSPAYYKICSDGITSQSMEINVKDGSSKDNVFEIRDFTFTAFCLLGDDINPCFESASLQLFSCNELDSARKQFTEMMNEFKECFALDYAIKDDSNLKGGEGQMDDKIELMKKYDLTEDMLDFKLEDFSVEELEEKFSAMTMAKEPEAAPEEPEAQPESEVQPEQEPESEESFALASNLRHSINDALGKICCMKPWGEEPCYYLEDYDEAAGEVYVIDCHDYTLWGMPYSVNGDVVTVDVEAKARKKYAIVDYEGGAEDPMPGAFSVICETIEQKYTEYSTDVTAKLADADKTIKEFTEELQSLRDFKCGVETEKAKNARKCVLDEFQDLTDDAAFAALVEEADKYSVDELEEKCFALRGRKQTAKFSVAEQKAPKLPIEKNNMSDEPYGGIFAEYGIVAE